MATSGKLNTSAWEGNNGTRYFELNWSRTGYDNAAQTTTIEWELISRGTYTGYIVCQKITVVIDGETVFDSATRRNVYPNQTITTGTKTLTHNLDGTKSFAASAKAAIYTSSVNSTGSATFTLNALDASTVVFESVPNFTDEQNPTITYRNPVGTALTKLEACISLAGSTDDIAYRNISLQNGSYTFYLTDAERKTLRAATTGSNSRKVWFYLRQVINGGTYYTSKQATFSIVNYQPTLTAGVFDTNGTTSALTGDANTLVRYHSTAYAYMTATPKKEASISTRYIEHNGAKTYAYSAAYSNVESDTFTFVATDSRNNTVSQKLTTKFVSYIKPTINIDADENMDTEGNYILKCDGNYFNAKFGDNAAAVANTLSIMCRYKPQNSDVWGEWLPMDITYYENTYNATRSFAGFDYRETYVFQCVLEDKLNTIYTPEKIVVSLPVFHWSATDFVFEVPVAFNAGATVGSVADAGTWQPTLTTAAAVSSYGVRQGWFQRVGNVITIGWQIKATINSGYNTTAVAISGLPFTPAYAAFGGGIAHNVYLTAGFCFEGWAAGTDGLITMRGQPCNNTAAGNLQINSTAYYPTGSNITITLAGSLTYIING